MAYDCNESIIWSYIEIERVGILGKLSMETVMCNVTALYDGQVETMVCYDLICGIASLQAGATVNMTLVLKTEATRLQSEASD
jgi:hypothetical protein